MKVIKPIVVRAGEYGDIEGMVDLLDELFNIEKDFSFDAEKQRDGLKMLLDDDGLKEVIVAVQDDLVVGMVTAQKLISTAEGGMVALVEDLVVKEECRRLGIGTQLLDEIVMWAQREGLSRVQLLMDKDNIPALKFYKKNEMGTTNMICMRKKF